MTICNFKGTAETQLANLPGKRCILILNIYMVFTKSGQMLPRFLLTITIEKRRDALFFSMGPQKIAKIRSNFFPKDQKLEVYYTERFGMPGAFLP